MNWDQIEGKWKQLKGDIRKKWADLTDNDIEMIKGNRDKLIGRLQELRGINREQAEREVEEWSRTYDQADRTLV